MRSLPLPLIRRLIPLKGLQEHALQSLLEQCEWQLTGRGQSLFSVADFESCHIYILSGEAELLYPGGVAVHTPEIPFPLGFGIAGVPVGFARTDCVCLRVDKQLLDRSLCWGQMAAATELELSYQPEHDEEAIWRLTLLKSNLFMKVSPININLMFASLKPMQVKAGEVILRQGESGEGCFFIRRGTATVTRQFPDEPVERHVLNIGYGHCLGEESLVYKTVRNATVTMACDGFLMRLDKTDFMTLLREPEMESIKSNDLDTALANGAVVLDVRSPDEFAVYHLRNASNTPLSSLHLLVSPAVYGNASLIVCCDTGKRSCAAVSLLQKQGLNARYLLNGLNGLSMDQRNSLLSVVLPFPFGESIEA
jgi:rhodanese-related sulfurtransferase